MPILLDTHAAIWGATGALEKNVMRLVDQSAERGELLISPITAWEIGPLVRKKRATLATTLDDCVRSIYSRPGVVTATLTPLIAASATALSGDFHADPADRILVATAAEYGAQPVTRDQAIHSYAKGTKYIRCIAC